MKRMFWSSFLLFTFAMIQLPSAAQAVDTMELRGKIDGVTVYRGQALVSRLVDVAGPAGLKEVVITDLPEQVQPGSIYAESAQGVEVRSVSYRVRPVEKDVRIEVSKLDDQIRAVTDRINANQKRMQLLAEQKDYLGRLGQFAATTASVELTKGVLNAETLQKLTQNQFEQRSKIADEELKLGIELRDLNEQSQTLQRQRAQIAGSSSRLAREAVVFLNLPGPNGKVYLRYLVNNATWLPSYNVRTTTARDKITLEYLASVQQLSGEDWPEVQMTLSTATPSLVAKAPLLTELNINLSRPGDAAQNQVLAQIEKGGYAEARQNLREQQDVLGNFRNTLGQGGNINNFAIAGNNNGVSGGRGNPAGSRNGGAPAVQQFQQAQQGQQIMVSNPEGNILVINGSVINIDNIGDNNDFDINLNKTAGDLQLVDLLARERIIRSRDARSSRQRLDEGMAVTYHLSNRTSLPSRSDRQLIQIAVLPLSAQFYKIACPLLTNYVYDEAMVTNDGATVLLAGEVSTYIDSQFVGKGAIPSVAIGQNFTVGLGIDSSLRTSRELVEKNESTQGGNRVVDFSYRLSLENFGTKPATVRLIDRLPVAKENEVRVTLAAPGKELSKDAAYEQNDRKKGILRWDLEVPAQAVDTKALSLEYQFKLEYDRQMSISSSATISSSR